MTEYWKKKRKLGEIKEEWGLWLRLMEDVELIMLVRSLINKATNAY